MCIRDRRVCLIDVDLGLRNLDVMMGLENRIIYDLGDVMAGRCILSQAMLQDKTEKDLYLLPACKNLHIDRFQIEDLKAVTNQLIQSFDYVLLDAPAGIEKGFQACLACAARAIIVTTLDVTSLQDADRIIGCMMQKQLVSISFVAVSYTHLIQGLEEGAVNGKRPLCIGVTQLTSTSKEAMNEELGIPGEVLDCVIKYAKNAKEAGLDGVVCSVHEARAIHEACGKDFLTVTPGIRLRDDSKYDQKRVSTPAFA